MGREERVGCVDGVNVRGWALRVCAGKRMPCTGLERGYRLTIHGRADSSKRAKEAGAGLQGVDGCRLRRFAGTQRQQFHQNTAPTKIESP